LQLAIFNPDTSLLDLTTAATQYTGTPGQPILTNSSGVVDPSLITLPSAVIPAQRTVTNSTTLTQSDSSVFADATAGGLTITLLNAATCPGYSYTLKKLDSTANVVTIQPVDSQTIDRASNYLLSAQNQVVVLQSNGINWEIIGGISIEGGGGGGGLNYTLQVNTYSSALTLNFGTSMAQKVVLSGNIALTFSGAPSGPEVSVILTQDATGGWVPTFDSHILAVNFQSVDTTPSTSTVLKFIFDGTNYLLASSPISGQ
jgi:hypothetical protein